MPKHKPPVLYTLFQAPPQESTCHDGVGEGTAFAIPHPMNQSKKIHLGHKAFNRKISPA
jgi:hypothetical protein